MNITASKTIKGILYTLIGSALSALGLYYFVYPSSFAPTGVDGIAAMIQSGISKIEGMPQGMSDGMIAGIITIAINAPLLILSFIFLNKKFSFYTILCTLASSFFLMIYAKVGFPQYKPETSTNILPAIFSGVLIGVRTGLVLKIGGSSGGVDIVAALLQKKNPYINIEKYISFFCYIIIGVSFFVYRDGDTVHGLEAVMLSIIQMFVFEKTAEFILRSTRNAVEFKIITNDTESLKKEILSVIKHGATVVESKGMFTGEEKSMVFCVVNTRQVPEFMKILKKHDDLFVYCTNVSSVNGNFRWNKEDIAK